MALFKKSCATCGVKEDIQRCPFCKKDVCTNCLKPLILKDSTPMWFTGKEVTNYLEFTKLYMEYSKVFEDKGGHIHCCNDFMKQSWTGIIRQIRKFQKNSHQKISKITLK
ncbi:hypothetical protein ACFL6L_00970 [candidate division KSB1 bacterium]